MWSYQRLPCPSQRQQSRQLQEAAEALAGVVRDEAACERSRGHLGRGNVQARLYGVRLMRWRTVAAGLAGKENAPPGQKSPKFSQVSLRFNISLALVVKTLG